MGHKYCVTFFFKQPSAHHESFKVKELILCNIWMTFNLYVCLLTFLWHLYPIFKMLVFLGASSSIRSIGMYIRILCFGTTRGNHTPAPPPKKIEKTL